jgi:UDP-GlcNAc:undecaprenyl-phosphate/decaprenyl-phosphate GlcNAc-1-phosphate transferase
VLSILIAITSTYIAIYLLRHFAHKINLLDVPNDRKTHKGNVPLIGGIAMYIGVVASLLLTSNDFSPFYYFTITSGVILILGFLDDFSQIAVGYRLIVQALIAIFVVTVVGVNLESFGDLFGNGEIFLKRWNYLISVLAIILAINAINMSDGIHGLAGASSFITLSAILYLSRGSISQEIVQIVSLFCVVIPVFLVNNICFGADKSKRIFMGDAGSMLLGFVIVWALISLSQDEEYQSFAPVTALWLFAFPLIEMFTVVIRRLVSGKSPFKPDLSHSHHLLIRLGLNETTTLLFLALFSLLMAVFGVLGELYGVDENLMFISFLLVFVLYLFLYIFAARKAKN